MLAAHGAKLEAWCLSVILGSGNGSSPGRAILKVLCWEIREIRGGAPPAFKAQSNNLIIHPNLRFNTGSWMPSSGSVAQTSIFIERKHLLERHELFSDSRKKQRSVPWGHEGGSMVTHTRKNQSEDKVIIEVFTSISRSRWTPSPSTVSVLVASWRGGFTKLYCAVVVSQPECKNRGVCSAGRHASSISTPGGLFLCKTAMYWSWNDTKQTEIQLKQIPQGCTSN